MKFRVTKSVTLLICIQSVFQVFVHSLTIDSSSVPQSTFCSITPQSAATVYSPYDGVVKEIVVPEEETAHLEKALVILEVEDEATGGGVTSYTHCLSCSLFLSDCK